MPDGSDIPRGPWGLFSDEAFGLGLGVGLTDIPTLGGGGSGGGGDSFDPDAFDVDAFDPDAFAGLA